MSHVFLSNRGACRWGETTVGSLGGPHGGGGGGLRARARFSLGSLRGCDPEWGWFHSLWGCDLGGVPWSVGLWSGEEVVPRVLRGSDLTPCGLAACAKPWDRSRPAGVRRTGKRDEK